MWKFIWILQNNRILKNIKVLFTLITTVIIAHFVISALDAPEINNVAKTHIAIQGGGSGCLCLKTYPLQLT